MVCGRVDARGTACLTRQTDLGYPPPLLPPAYLTPAFSIAYPTAHTPTAHRVRSRALRSTLECAACGDYSAATRQDRQIGARSLVNTRARGVLSSPRDTTRCDTWRSIDIRNSNDIFGRSPRSAFRESRVLHSSFSLGEKRFRASHEFFFFLLFLFVFFFIFSCWKKWYIWFYTFIFIYYVKRRN